MIVSSSLIRNSTWVRSEFWQISKLDVQLWFSHRLLFKLIALVVVRVNSISQSHPLVPEWSPHVTMLDSTKCHVLPYLTWPWRTPPPSAPSTRRRSSSASAFLLPTQQRPCWTWKKELLINQSIYEDNSLPLGVLLVELDAVLLQVLLDLLDLLLCQQSRRPVNTHGDLVRNEKKPDYNTLVSRQAGRTSPQSSSSRFSPGSSTASRRCPPCDPTTTLQSSHIALENWGSKWNTPEKNNDK